MLRVLRCIFSLLRLLRTIRCQERSLSIPLPRIPGSTLCPVTLYGIICVSTLVRLMPRFSHLFPARHSAYFPSLIAIFVLFFSSPLLSAIGLVPAHYSPHSFRRGGASFAFKCNVPEPLIHLSRDDSCSKALRSAYGAVHMAANVLHLSSP